MHKRRNINIPHAMTAHGMTLALVVAMVAIGVQGHGYMKDPPARQTLRNPSSGIIDCATGGPIQWSQSGLFCGGAGTQAKNGGKCSACGDNYLAPYPRTHDLGGPFVKQLTFARAYLQGQSLTVAVDITAAHKGAFQVRLCPLNEGTEGPDDLTQCYIDPEAHYVLRTPTGATSTAVTSTGMYYMEVMLPAAVNCPNGCNMQWWYRTGNSWGCDASGQCGLGLGDQEHFVNCADVLILNCQQYNAMTDDSAWCGKGPTPELNHCATMTSDPSDAGDDNTNQESGVGNTADEGATGNTANGGGNTANGGATGNTTDGGVNTTDSGTNPDNTADESMNPNWPANTGPYNPSDEDVNPDKEDSSKSDSDSNGDKMSASSDDKSTGNSGSDNTPPGGDSSPAGADNSPAGGDSSPAGGDNSHPGGDNSPPGGDNSSPGGDNSPTGGEKGPFVHLPASSTPACPEADMTCAQCYAAGYDYCATCCVQETVNEFKGNLPRFDDWCENSCAVGNCPDSHCRVVTVTKATKVCRLPAVNSGANDANIDDDVGDDVNIKPIKCEECAEMHAVACANDCCRKSDVKRYKGVLPRFNDWCNNNCRRGKCPTSHCVTVTSFTWEDVCENVFKKLLNELMKLDKSETK